MEVCSVFKNKNLDLSTFQKKPSVIIARKQPLSGSFFHLGDLTNAFIYAIKKPPLVIYQRKVVFSYAFTFLNGMRFDLKSP